MIEVHSQPIIEPDPQGGWQMTFWMGEAFDYTTPFRAALGEIADALSREIPSSIRLPDYEEGEDFVEGTLQFGGEVRRVYYEHSLSHFSLSSDSEATLHDVAARLRSILNVG